MPGTNRPSPAARSSSSSRRPCRAAAGCSSPSRRRWRSSRAACTRPAIARRISRAAIAPATPFPRSRLRARQRGTAAASPAFAHAVHAEVDGLEPGRWYWYRFRAGGGTIVNVSSGAAIGPGRGPYPDPTAGARGGTCYGAEKAALERFTQGLAAEVYPYRIAVTCVAPSQIVPTPGTVYHRLLRSLDDPRGEPPLLMAQAALLLVTEPLDRVTGRVTYSQQLLKEFGWITEARGRGVETPGSGYAAI